VHERVGQREWNYIDGVHKELGAHSKLADLRKTASCAPPESALVRGLPQGNCRRSDLDPQVGR